MSKVKNILWLDLIRQQFKMDTASFCMLKKVYRLHKKQYQLSLSKKELAAQSPEYSFSEFEQCLSKLNADAYLNVSGENIFLTDKGIFFVESNRKIKCISIIIEIIISLLVIGFFVKRIL